MPYENIKLEVDGKIATITMSRPERRHALDLPTVEELHRALADVRDARCTAPPENMLKMPSMPPACELKAWAKALGSIPGNGI